jgi:hypothetical protein
MLMPDDNNHPITSEDHAVLARAAELMQEISDYIHDHTDLHTMVVLLTSTSDGRPSTTTVWSDKMCAKHYLAHLISLYGTWVEGLSRLSKATSKTPEEIAADVVNAYTNLEPSTTDLSP